VVLSVGISGVAANAWAQTAGTTSLVRVSTAAGPIDIELYDDSAPKTVANFLNYVRSGAYEGSLFHRLVRGFVIQGGGLRWSDTASTKISAVPTNAPVVNEFSASRSNVRGTVAMAKVDGNPDSATSQWFVNLVDNAANLDGQNGGFTVFGRVTAPSMAVVDGLANLSLINASACTNLGTGVSVMTQAPMYTTPSNCGAVTGAHVVQMNVRELPRKSTDSATERVFNYLEAAYPKLIYPANQATQTAAGFSYRYYAATQTYVGVQGDQLYALALSSSTNLIPLGNLSQWLSTAQGQGY
jgi:cyclophilin family peptidyl-prolyl cis-trans isomerase